MNSFHKRKILCLPDYTKQLGRDKEEFQLKRKKNKDFAREDAKTIEKKIDFHKYLAKKYNQKMSFFLYNLTKGFFLLKKNIEIGPTLQIKTDNLPFSYDQLMTKRFKIL